MHFSRRTQWDLTTNRIVESIEQIKKKHSDFIDLTISNPTECAFDFPQQKILQALTHSDNLKYQPQSQGLASARQAVVDYYGIQH